jgi:hypothetical protein
MQNITLYRIGKPLLCVSLVLLMGPAAAIAQSGSAGGSIGNDEKSVSGSRSAEPDRSVRRNQPDADDARRSATKRGSGGGGGGGGGNFDGAWVVSSAGTPCGSGTAAIVVTSGKIIGEGIRGTVSPSGAASAVSNYGNMTVISSGRFSGRGGSGTFKRSDGCVGTWAVSKQ